MTSLARYRPLRYRLFVRAVVVAALVLVACGSSAGTSASTVTCDLSGVPTAPPTASLVKGVPLPAASDPSRIIADAAARDDAALAAYRASGCDPRALKQVSLSHISGSAAMSLEEAVARADTIVVGRVRSLDPLEVFSPAQGGPLSTAHVDVAQTLKGTARRTIDVKQFGGIALQPEGLVLGHLGAELILPGDEVVLFVEQRVGAFWAVYPLGAVRVQGAVLDPTVRGTYEQAGTAIRAMTRTQLLARVQELTAAH
jgi:hypothetical protein